MWHYKWSGEGLVFHWEKAILLFRTIRGDKCLSRVGGMKRNADGEAAFQRIVEGWILVVEDWEKRKVSPLTFSPPLSYLSMQLVISERAKKKHAFFLSNSNLQNTWTLRDPRLLHLNSTTCGTFRERFSVNHKKKCQETIGYTWQQYPPSTNIWFRTSLVFDFATFQKD